MAESKTAFNSRGHFSAYICYRFLAPMLENAGANIFIPRERDFNKNEVIVDNDISTGKSKVLLPGYFRIDTIDSGFKYKDTLFNNENPFRSGTYLMAHPDASKQLAIRYIPDIPKTGEYAVYISYGAGGSKIVNYTINYTGGFREFLVDQTQEPVLGFIWVHFISKRFQS